MKDWDKVKDNYLFNKLSEKPIPVEELVDRIKCKLFFKKQEYFSSVFSVVKTIPCTLEQTQTRKEKIKIKATVKHISSLGKMFNKIMGKTYLELLEEYKKKNDGDSVVEIVKNRELILQLESDIKAIDKKTIAEPDIAENGNKKINNTKRKADEQLVYDNWGNLDSNTKELLANKFPDKSGRYSFISILFLNMKYVLIVR